MAKKKKEENISEIEKSFIPYSQKPIGELTEEAYVRFGGYVNNFRHIVKVQDSLKTSYRRLIHAALSFPLGKDIPTVNLIGKMSETHPHSLTGIEGTVRMFVHSGVFDGDGNFGRVYIDGSEADPAAPRYTKVRISDKYANIFGTLIKEVHWSESPVGALEPDYIPAPVPFCLSLSERVQGLGVGIRTDLPNFSAKSMYEAYINNNPLLLEPNIDLILDKERSQLYELWTTGKGIVTYSYHLAKQKSEDGKTEGVLFYGDTGVFTVNTKNKKLKKLLDEGKITIDNVSDQNGTKMLISRVPGARGVTIEDIERICEQICYKSDTYVLNVTDGNMAFRIPLYNWIDYTYKNYLELISQVNQKKINQVKYEIEIQKAIPIVVDYILNKNPKADIQEISDSTGIIKEVVSGVMSKPISHLRKNKDTSERIKELKSKLSELKKFDPVKYTYEVIQKL